ncbi:MAG: hypothetical protein CL933_17915 [Deltaproteobacteria bacterium]|nr:hypothetical protein [Deltaproteobacteria bacterium]
MGAVGSRDRRIFRGYRSRKNEAASTAVARYPPPIRGGRTTGPPRSFALSVVERSSRRNALSGISASLDVRNGV